MITTDLKLLIDVAWRNRNGQKAYDLVNGEYSAADRLVKRELLVNIGAGRVGITENGQELVRKLSGRVSKS